MDQIETFRNKGTKLRFCLQNGDQDMIKPLGFYSFNIFFLHVIPN